MLRTELAGCSIVRLTAFNSASGSPAMVTEAVAVVLRNWRRVFFALMTCGIGRPELLEFGWFEVEPVTNSLRGSDSEGIWPQRAQRSQRLENLPFPQINH